jgi:N-acyl-D-amino-acid deacylase
MAINYAANIGHSALRTWAMGDRAFEEAGNDDDRKVMEQALAEALEAGAIGLTTSRSDNHLTSDDRPVASRLAPWSEVAALTEVMGRARRGLFELAMEPALRSEDPVVRQDFADRIRNLAVTTGVPITFGVPSGPGSNHYLDLIDSTNEAGGRMFGQSHSRGISVVLSFQTQLPFDQLPDWREFRARPAQEQLSALRSPDVRSRLVRSACEGPYHDGVGAEAGRPRYDRMLVFDHPLPPHRTVAEIAGERGVDPVEVMIDLALRSDFQQLFVQPLTSPVDEDILAVMTHPQTVMTFSDAGAHVSQVIDCSIQTYLLAYWVRQRQSFALEDAIRMITSVPARAWGFVDRGLLKPGLVADINVLDPASVGPTMPTVASDLPAGGIRLLQRATGVKATVVSGEVAFEDGAHTGALAGSLLRSGRRPA